MNPIRIALDKATGSATLLRRATLCAVIAALAGIAVHVAGSLAMTGLGFAMVALVRDRL